MLPLISIPTIVEHYAPNFKSAFSEAEYEHLKKYVSGLGCTIWNKNFPQLFDCFYNQKNL